MTAVDLGLLLDVVRDEGWAEADCSLDEFRGIAAAARWEEVTFDLVTLWCRS
ncbi:MAG: hypothetical protein QOI54_3384 [Actinomycetota bacterium]|jgi:hypothetical protein|nr:hypothetical protein [Actinomycetota bacterium]